MLIYKVINYLLRQWYLSDNKRYIRFLRKKGIEIGINFVIHGSCKNILIDLTRPTLISIGDNVQINRNFTLLTHDYTTSVFINLYDEFISSSGSIKIGNNVSFAMNCAVLKGVTIGDNCFIGYGSVVTKDIPSNSVAVGSPAKVICTIDEYFKKRKKMYIEEAFLYARSIEKRFKRRPVIEDFWEEFPLFLNGEQDHPKLPIKKQLGKSFENYREKHHAIFDGFEVFLKEAGL